MAENKELQKTEQEKAPAQKKPTLSEQFTNTVMRRFGTDIAGDIKITEYQKGLIQGYFVSIDRALKVAEDNRQRKGKEPLPVTWSNVNINDLALDLVHYARVGLDMLQDNHLFPIPYKNNKTNQYDITLMEGYNGIQYIAERYAYEKPKAVTIELVHKTDTFRPIKRCSVNPIESYEFEITNPFDRGDVIGGFGYIEYNEPLKNRLIIMTLADILKRKPQYAAPEFWGGKKKVWENGVQVEKDTDGWFEEMCLKTIKREVYSAKNIPRDPQKIDETYHYLKEKEMRNAAIEAQAEIDEKAGRIVIDPDEITDPAPAPVPDTPPETPQLPSHAKTGEFEVDEQTGEIISGGDKSADLPPYSPSDETAPSDGYTANGQMSLGDGPDF